MWSTHPSPKTPHTRIERRVGSRRFNGGKKIEGLGSIDGAKRSCSPAKLGSVNGSKSSAVASKTIVPGKMYVTRRLLQSTIDETKTDGPKSDEAQPVSPRKRRPLLTTRSGAAEEEVPIKEKDGAEQEMPVKRNRKGKPLSVLRGCGMLIDARDSHDRWCEAKILNLNADERSVFIHYVGWNSRYDCWLGSKHIAAHGSHTHADTKPGKSWNGKDSLFVDPTKPTIKAKKASRESDKKQKKQKSSPGEVEGEVAATPPKKKSKAEKTSKKQTSKKAKVPKIEVRVNAVDEESERSTRQSRKEKVDLELDMDVEGAPRVKIEPSGTAAVSATRPKSSLSGKKSPAAKKSPIAKKSPVANKSPVAKESPVAAPRRSSPHPVEKEEEEAKEEESEAMVHTKLSPTVGMSALRRSARATLASRQTDSKKRKKADSESDEDYVEEEEEEEEEEDEEDEEEDEVSESDGEVSVRRHSVSKSNGKAKRSSRPATGAPRIHGGLITQWQTDPAYVETKQRLSSIFRQRLLQRGELSSAFHDSFQQAMSGSEASPGSSPARMDDAEREKGGAASAKKKKKARKMTSEEQANAEAAAYYYQYHIQAYQYHQYMYYQAMMAHQLQMQQAEAASQRQEQAEIESESKREREDAKSTADKGASPPQPGEKPRPPPVVTDGVMMAGGIIDPRFIHARMDALEEQRRLHEHYYFQHYHQATERNLEVLASNPQYLQSGADAWRQQLQHDQKPRADDSKAESSPEKKPSDCNKSDSPMKGDEARPAQDTVAAESVEKMADSPVNEIKSESSTEPGAVSRAHTPEATPEAAESPKSTPVKPADEADIPSSQHASPRKPDATPSTANKADSSEKSSEGVLFELEL